MSYFRSLKKSLIVLICFVFTVSGLWAGNVDQLLQQGWKELIKDNDTAAIKLFNEAYLEARKENNAALMAEALLQLGIASYGASFNQGLNYASAAMEQYKKLEFSDPQKALTGRCKCLQLISTIKSRQGKYRESIALSKEALLGFPSSNDTSSTLGLIYSTLGGVYGALGISDSSEYFHRLALQEREITKNTTYLPSSYLSVATIEIKNGNKSQSKIYLDLALQMADSTENRQALSSVYIGLAKWTLNFEKDETKSESLFLKSKKIAEGLSDKSFLLKALSELRELQKQQGHYKEALLYEEQIREIKDTLANWEKEKVTRSLEVQFNMAEKDRLLNLAQQEKKIIELNNYLLWGTLSFLILLAGSIILFLRRLNIRDKLLLLTKEKLFQITEEKKRLKEQQMQNEIEFKESQLNAITLQLLQKNDLMQELNEKLMETKEDGVGSSIKKIISPLDKM